MIDDSNKTFIDSLIFWQDKPVPGTIVDPAKEQQRLRDAQADRPALHGADSQDRASSARPPRRHLLRPLSRLPPLRRRALLGGLVAGAGPSPSSRPSRHSASPSTRRPAETFTLGNGLQVIVLPSRRAPIVTQVLIYKVGGADEVFGRTGIAHFLEHMMFKGTATLGAGELSRIIARNGGRENAFTDFDIHRLLPDDRRPTGSRW